VWSDWLNYVVALPSWKPLHESFEKTKPDSRTTITFCVFPGRYSIPEKILYKKLI
jgi:hypothetical protein